jgi:hypothetical protein
LTHIIDYQQSHNMPINETWIDMAANVNIPIADSGIVKEYRGMPNNVTVKQADVLLMMHPLLPKLSLKDQRASTSYYLGKQSPDGPAMTSAIAAVLENQIAQSGVAAFTYELAAQEPYLRTPFFEASEQANDDKNANGGTSPAQIFLTAHAGAMQIAIYGYLGVKYSKSVPTFRPSLPSPHKQLAIPDIHFWGNLLRAVMNSTHTNITRLPLAADVIKSGVVGDHYHNQSTPITIQRRSLTGDEIEETHYNIAMNETITVENDMYWQRPTTLKNVLQGQPTSSKADHHTAQYPEAATDGNTGTRWQPLSIDPAELVVNTSMVPFQRVTQMNFDWGPRVPASVQVLFTNRTDLFLLEDVHGLISIAVTPNKIYGVDAGTPQLEVVPYEGNRTTLNSTQIGNGTFTGILAILRMHGCPGCGLTHRILENGTTIWQSDGRGATLGEFEVVGEKGTDTVKNMAKETADERQRDDPRDNGDILTPKLKDEGT